ncbi:E3 ubiquitin-protein ligase TRIM21-like [Notolabrus celidotus]|uniref:E3 ubiquitin-protein ligase TRIM21-like n=1 Tax=Notolabrus celidotus TaxID=1203425 RepID=UPI00149022BA|nr:E3 ubiquitin-protein ligase TRIM21-like [Notolabrus celidotus]
MAHRRSLTIVDNFSCSICLDVFTEPVGIPCGHTFCSACITGHWDTSKPVFHCPLCKKEYLKIPDLCVNTVIADMVEKVKKVSQEEPHDTPDQAGSGYMLCGICTEKKQLATKSCLTCFMSYCKAHLEPHQRVLTLKKHKLINPVEDLESRICKEHGEPLELFCKKDFLLLCEACVDSDHKKHKVVNVEVEAEMRKDQLGLEKKDIDQMFQAHQQKLQEIQHSVEASRKNKKKALEYSNPVMTELVDYIRRSQAELNEVIQRKQKKIEKEGEGFIKELEEEMVQIRQKNSELDQVCGIDDPFEFLEHALSLTFTPPLVKDWSEVTLNSDQFTVQETLVKLETTVMREIRLLCDPDLKRMQHYAVDLTLDPETAHPALIISEDGKEVKCGDKKRNVGDKPERFDHVLNVLAKESFNSGKFYFEVQVQGKTQWDLGVVNESINRKGDIRVSPKSGYWTIWLRKGNEFTANAGPAINLHVRDTPQKVGVFVDYEEAQVSFYDVDSRAHIFSFTGCNFTEKLYPYFGPCAIESGKKSAPLIITPVNCSR